MIKIQANDGQYLVVDFEGILSKAQEEVIAWSFLGKSTESTAEITNKKPETVKKQKSISYEKNEVNGTDNPLAVLMCKAFQQGFARFIVFILCFVCLVPAVRTNTRIPVSLRVAGNLRTPRIEGALYG